MLTKERVTHTPGPWGLETVRTSVGVCHKIGAFPTGLPHKPTSYGCVYEDGLGSQALLDRGSLDTELMANARLMAAAPELLAALKAMVASYDGLRDVLTSGIVLEKLKAAETAIAKAEGRV